MTINPEVMTMREAMQQIAIAKREALNRPTSVKLTRCHDGVWRHLHKAERPDWNEIFTTAPEWNEWRRKKSGIFQG